MKKLLPMCKKVGRNISLPFFIDLWLRERFKSTECSPYLVKLIISDMRNKDPDFCIEFNREIDSIK